MRNAQRSDRHRTCHLRDLSAGAAHGKGRAQRRQKHDRQQQRRIARRRRDGPAALVQHIDPELCEQGLRLRGIRNGQFTEGVICLLRKRGFQRRRAEIRCLLSRNIVGKRPRRARRKYQQHSQKHKQPLFHKHSPIMVKNVRISGSAA